jgi:hypothetical protein
VQFCYPVRVSNRWFRFVIALLAIGLASGAAYRIIQHERQLAIVADASQRANDAAESAMATVSELKAALHAYVAPGQGRDFWTARSAMLLEKLRASLLDLESAAAILNVSLTDELDLSDRVAAAEQRAREHAGNSQALLAGEVIFTEARDLLDSMRQQAAHIHDEVAQRAGSQITSARREQALLAAAAAGVMALAILVLVPPARPVQIAQPVPVSVPRTGETSANQKTSSAANQVERPPAARGVIPSDRLPKVRVGSIEPVAPIAAPVSGPPPPPPADAPTPAASTERRPTPAINLPDAAAVCTAFGRVSESAEISLLLARAASVLSASGLIVWVASEQGSELLAAAASGYDERLFARLGPIARDASNLTANAFRDGKPHTRNRGTGTAAALTVPLLGPLGPVGVFSAELREIGEVDADRLALAAIFAAQLAGLLGSMTVVSEIAPRPEQAQAQA